MLSISKCKRIINKKGQRKYSDEEIKVIRNFLYQIAEIDVSEYYKERRSS